MSFTVNIDNRPYCWSRAQVQYRFNLLNNYYYYRQPRRENVITAIFRAVVQLFNWIQYKIIFGSEEHATRVLHALRPLVRDDHDLVVIFNQMAPYKRLELHPVPQRCSVAVPVPQPFSFSGWFPGLSSTARGHSHRHNSPRRDVPLQAGVVHGAPPATLHSRVPVGSRPPHVVVSPSIIVENPMHRRGTPATQARMVAAVNPRNARTDCFSV